MPTSSRGPHRCTGAGPTGSTESVSRSPAQTRFITSTRRAISAMVCVDGSAPTAR